MYKVADCTSQRTPYDSTNKINWWKLRREKLLFIVRIIQNI